MNRKLLCVIFTAAFAVAGTLQGGSNQKGDKALEKIQGTWKFVSQANEGKEMPKDQVAKMKITFTDDKWSVTSDGKVVQAGTHKLDASKKPGTVDAVITEGENKGTTMLGIFEMPDDNTMKVCFDQKGKERPTSFMSKAGQFNAEIQREKK